MAAKAHHRRRICAAAIPDCWREILFQDTATHFSNLAATKITYLKTNFVGFFMGAMMAGAYVGIAMMLTLSLGNDVEPSAYKLVMGCFFGIALTLIIFAGAELFSGHTMFMAFGFLHKKVGFFTALYDWVVCWSGNLVGAVLLSILFALGGGGGWMHDETALVHEIAEFKVNSSIIELIARGAICNWLICLAIWMTARTKNDTAKCILIFWCLFAFVAAGFEHGIANMTVFTISMLGAHADSVTVLSVWYNLIWVSIGNIVGGAGFIGVAYHLTGVRQT